MTRSKRKTPICGVTGGSDKKDKRTANKRFRKIMKDVTKFVRLREISDVWCFNKDGKFWFGDNEKLMRK